MINTSSFTNIKTHSHIYARLNDTAMNIWQYGNEYICIVWQQQNILANVILKTVSHLKVLTENLNDRSAVTNWWRHFTARREVQNFSTRNANTQQKQEETGKLQTTMSMMFGERPPRFDSVSSVGERGGDRRGFQLPPSLERQNAERQARIQRVGGHDSRGGHNLPIGVWVIRRH